MIHAVDIANSYDHAIEAFWRGDPFALRCLDQWLQIFRAESCPDVSGEAVAWSLHGAGGRGIRWTESDTVVFGTVPGASKCYRIPIEAYLPADPETDPVEPPRPSVRQIELERTSPQSAPQCTSHPWGATCDCEAARASR
jgi:hypothetical protein